MLTFSSVRTEPVTQKHLHFFILYTVTLRQYESYQILKCATQIDGVTKLFHTANWMSADVILWQLNPEENESRNEIDFPWQTPVFFTFFFFGWGGANWALGLREEPSFYKNHRLSCFPSLFFFCWVGEGGKILFWCWRCQGASQRG